MLRGVSVSLGIQGFRVYRFRVWGLGCNRFRFFVDFGGLGLGLRGRVLVLRFQRAFPKEPPPVIIKHSHTGQYGGVSMLAGGLSLHCPKPF